MGHISSEELSLRLKELAQKVVIGGKYFHYKQPENLYEVVGVGLIEETETPAVIYHAHYGEGLIWIRPESDFLAKVEFNGSSVDRFTFKEETKKPSEDSFHLGIKGLIRNSKGEILLLKVNPAALKKQTDPYWDLPGGRINKGESVETTLQREIFEETGISEIQSIKPVTMVLSKIRIPIDNADVGLILSIYDCVIDDNSVIKLSNEHLEAKWFSVQEASELLKVKYPAEFTEVISKI